MHDIKQRNNEVAQKTEKKREKNYDIDESIDVNLYFTEADEKEDEESDGDSISDNTLPDTPGTEPLKTSIEPLKTVNPAEEYLMEFTGDDIPDRDPEQEPVDVDITEEHEVKEDEAVEADKGKKKKGKYLAAGLGIIILAFILTFAASLAREYFRDSGPANVKKKIIIQKGATTEDVAAILKNKGIIRYETPFLAKVYFSEYRGKLRYGTFLLHDGMSLEDIISGIATGSAQSADYAFTMPEGYTIKQTAQKLDKEGKISGKDFIKAVEAATANFKYPDELPDANKVFYQLEGYLYPDTYNLMDDEGAEELVAMMLDEFYEKYDKAYKEKGEKTGYSMKEVVTRASLLMKETERLSEYPMIAGVINNRFKIGMRLQFDSTVVYAMTEGEYGVSRVMHKDLKLDSPYNTYVYEGLPAGPICNPSINAIEAVLKPRKHEYLYFQTDVNSKDGKNLFFKTWEEHGAAASTRNK